MTTDIRAPLREIQSALERLGHSPGLQATSLASVLFRLTTAILIFGGKCGTPCLVHR